MHRRSKRKRRTNGSSSQYVAEDDEGSSERRNRVASENKTDCESIVISDSDDAELEEESIFPQKKVRPQQYRKTLAAKRNIANLTEEEQLALAVKISQQEQANHVKYRPEDEDEEEILKKAIQDSLHSCRVPDISPHITAQELTNETDSCKNYTRPQELFEELPLSQLSRCSQENSQKSPIVLLKRLSQDIVESSSVILSPNLKYPYIECCKEPPLSPCSSIDFENLSPCKTVAVSPVFTLKSPFKRRVLPCRLFHDSSPSVKSLPNEIDDQCSHCSESSHQDSMSMLPTSESELSNVPQDKGTCEENLSNEIAATSSKRDMTSVQSHESSSCNATIGHKNKDTRHYYWGIPFCPKGVDPSTYTQVILCQLEVYQKSLKRAQRNLLHKMDYGQPIQSKRSSNKQLKSNFSQEEDTEEIIDDCDLQKTGETERGHPNDSDCSETQNVLTKRQKVSRSPVHKSPGGDDSPSLKVEQCSSQGLFTKVLPGECAGLSPRALGESAVSPTVMRSHKHLVDRTEDTLDDEITICPESQPSPARQDDSDKEVDPYLIEPSTEPLAGLSNGPAAEDIECLEQICPNNVECPICGCTFSHSQIERHAAYCDGINRQQEMAALRPRHKLNKKCNTLRNHTGSEDNMLSADSGKYEKCYLCKSLVSLREYQGHVDNCLQTAVFETEGSPRLRSIRGSAGRDGRLLRMLDKSESTSNARNCSRQGLPRCSSSSANTNSLDLSNSKAEGNRNVRDSSYMSPPREEQNLNISSELVNVSDSPIKSFVSISEAKDCLVDFKKQFSRRPNNKESSRRGRRKRM